MLDDALKKAAGGCWSRPPAQRSRLAERRRATAAPPGPVAVDALSVDQWCRTTAPGVFAAGDVSTQTPPQVATAMAAGSLAGSAVVQSLLTDGVG